MKPHACPIATCAWPSGELVATFERFPAEMRERAVNAFIALAEVAETQGWPAYEARVDLHKELERALRVMDGHHVARMAPTEGPRWFAGVALWASQAVRDRCGLCAHLRPPAAEQLTLTARYEAAPPPPAPPPTPPKAAQGRAVPPSAVLPVKVALEEVSKVLASLRGERR